MELQKLYSMVQRQGSETKDPQRVDLVSLLSFIVSEIFVKIYEGLLSINFVSKRYFLAKLDL